MLFWYCRVLQMVQNSAPCQKITFRHLFLSALGLQLYLSLNNLRLFFFPSFFVIFLPTSLHLSYSQVAGIKGVFLSNKVVENQVKTYITYNKGRDWRLLQAPTTDLQGNKVYCEQVSGPLTGDTFGYLYFHYLLKKILHWIYTVFTLDRAMSWSKSDVHHINTAQNMSVTEETSQII